VPRVINEKALSCALDLVFHSASVSVKLSLRDSSSDTCRLNRCLSTTRKLTTATATAAAVVLFLVDANCGRLAHRWTCSIFHLVCVRGWWCERVDRPKQYLGYATASDNPRSNRSTGLGCIASITPPTPTETQPSMAGHRPYQRIRDSRRAMPQQLGLHANMHGLPPCLRTSRVLLLTKANLVDLTVEVQGHLASLTRQETCSLC
jgi:hypothetical protein